MTITGLHYRNFVEAAVRLPYLRTTTSDNTLTTVFKNTVKAIARAAILPATALTGIVCHSKEYLALHESSDKKAPLLRELQQWLVIDEIKQAALQIQSAAVTVAGTASNTASDQTVFSRLCDEGKLTLAALFFDARSTNLSTHESQALSRAIILHRRNDLLANLLQQKKVGVEFEELFLKELHKFVTPDIHLSRQEQEAFYDTVFTHGQIYYTEKFTKWITSTIDYRMRPALGLVATSLLFSSDSVAKKSPLTVAIDKNDKLLVLDILKKKYTQVSDGCWKANGRAELFEFEMDKMIDFIVQTGASDVLAALFPTPFVPTPFDDPYMSFHKKLLARLFQTDNEDIKDRCIEVLFSNPTFFKSEEFRNTVPKDFEKRLGTSCYKKIVKFLQENYAKWELSLKAFPKSITRSFVDSK